MGRFSSRLGWVIVALAIAGCNKKSSDNGMQKPVEGSCNADSDCIIDCSKKDECCPVASCETAVLRSVATEITNYNLKACTDDKKKSCAPAGPSVASARCESGKCVAKRAGGSTPAGSATVPAGSSTASTPAGSATVPAGSWSGAGTGTNGSSGPSQPEGGGSAPAPKGDPFVVDMTPFSVACKSKADCRIVKNDPCDKCSCGKSPIASSEAMKFETALSAIDCKKAPKDNRRCGECRGNMPDCVGGKCIAVPEK